MPEMKGKQHMLQDGTAAAGGMHECWSRIGFSLACLPFEVAFRDCPGPTWYLIAAADCSRIQCGTESHPFSCLRSQDWSLLHAAVGCLSGRLSTTQVMLISGSGRKMEQESIKEKLKAIFCLESQSGTTSFFHSDSEVEVPNLNGGRCKSMDAWSKQMCDPWSPARQDPTSTALKSGAPDGASLAPASKAPGSTCFATADKHRMHPETLRNNINLAVCGYGIREFRQSGHWVGSLSLESRLQVPVQTPSETCFKGRSASPSAEAHAFSWLEAQTSIAGCRSRGCLLLLADSSLTSTLPWFMQAAARWSVYRRCSARRRAVGGRRGGKMRCHMAQDLERHQDVVMYGEGCEAPAVSQSTCAQKPRERSGNRQTASQRDGQCMIRSAS
jgi:hypothetical protein